MPRIVIPTVITTERLRLEIPTIERAETLAEFHRRNVERAAAAGLIVEKFRHPHDIAQHIQTAHTLHNEGRRHTWYIHRPEVGTPIGMIRCSRGPSPIVGSLSYLLDSQHVGQGLMHEACRAVVAQCDAAQITLNLNVKSSNRESIRLAERLGFAPTVVIKGWQEYRRTPKVAQSIG